MDARRHPILEWKEEERWKQEHEGYRIAAEQRRREEEARLEEKRAQRERKQKRKAQQGLTKQKEIEFRETLFQYEVDVAKSETRARLIAKFARADHKKHTREAAVEELAASIEREKQYKEQIANAIDDDRTQTHVHAAFVQQNIDSADGLGRRSGMLPAINTPPPRQVPEQDETSTLLILQLNTVDSTTPAVSNAELPSVNGTCSLSREAWSSTNAASTSKRLFFTVNLKRFKHVEEIRGEAIGNAGGVELARSLLTGACPRVKSIYLGWNHIKYSAVVSLADAFIRGACGQLRVLDLRFNGVDANAVTYLLAALDQGGAPELRELVLEGNLLGDDGARAFAHAMLRGTLKLLRVIDIRQNRIRNAGVLALWNVFTCENISRFCPKLMLLDMRRNDAQGAILRTLSPCPSYLQF